MCGILSIFETNNTGSELNIRRAVEGLESLHHRGPDSTNHRALYNKRVFLGHVRLSILDLEGGDQPLSNVGNDIHAVVNGEFYNFEKLRVELETKGHVFKTKSDSEILIHLYEEKGTACLEELRGEFAFVLWDNRQKRLFAARDRFGIKPLVWGWRGKQLYIASEAKALFRAGFPAKWDQESVYFSFCSQYLQPNRTLFDGVNQVEPGHFLLAGSSSFTIRKYWDLDITAAKEDSEDEELLVAKVRKKLDEAVRLRLRADVPVACYLSGGLDSSAVLGVAKKVSGKALPCFSISFDDEMYDEKAIAVESAKFNGAELSVVGVSDQDLYDHFASAVFHSEILAVNRHGAAKLLLSKAVQDAGIKVVLTGEGSDEIFAGYPHFRSDMKKLFPETELDLEKLSQTNIVSKGILMPQGETLNTEFLKKRLGYVPTFLETKAGLGFRNQDFLNDDFIREHKGKNYFRSLLDQFFIGPCLLYTSPSPRDATLSRMPASA